MAQFEEASQANPQKQEMKIEVSPDIAEKRDAIVQEIESKLGPTWDTSKSELVRRGEHLLDSHAYDDLRKIYTGDGPAKMTQAMQEIANRVLAHEVEQALVSEDHLRDTRLPQEQLQAERIKSLEGEFTQIQRIAAGDTRLSLESERQMYKRGGARAAAMSELVRDLAFGTYQGGVTDLQMLAGHSFGAPEAARDRETVHAYSASLVNEYKDLIQDVRSGRVAGDVPEPIIVQRSEGLDSGMANFGYAWNEEDQAYLLADAQESSE